MNKVKVLSLVVLISSSSLHAQYYRMKENITIQLRNELLDKADKLFAPTPQFQYDISAGDFVTTYNSLPDRKPYNEVYLKWLDSALDMDPKNPYILNQYGNYYSFYGYQAKAKLYFMKAYQNLYPAYFHNDTARLLAYRAIIEMNTGLGDPVEDMEEALRINPSDSLALAFYPMLLIGRQNFKKAKEVCAADLANKPLFPVNTYCTYGIADIMEQFVKVMQADPDKEQRAKYRKTDYDKIVDFKPLNEYADNYSGNAEMGNARLCFDIFALSFKMIFFEVSDTAGILFDFTPNEQKKLTSLKHELRERSANQLINPFSANKNLGMVCFMLHEWDSAIVYLNEALRVFPAGKRNEQFNTAGIYDILLNIYKYQNIMKFEPTLLKKISDEPEGRKNIHDYNLAARHFLTRKDYYRAEEWAVKALAIDSTSFEVYSLLTHIAFRLDKPQQVNYYAQCALRCPTPSNSDQYRFVMLFSLYYLASGNATSAYSNLEAARGLSPSGKCEMCDELETQFIEVTPK